MARRLAIAICIVIEALALLYVVSDPPATAAHVMYERY